MEIASSPRRTENSVSIIIPAYNEAENLGELLDKIKSLYPTFEVIVVDDGSNDHTSEVALHHGAIVIRHPYNIGNGAAVKTGIRSSNSSILVFMDGDGQHAPEDVGKLLEYFPAYDLVVGARGKKSQSSLARAVANKVYNWVGSYVSKFPIADLTSGFRAIKRDVALELLDLLPNTFSYPTTMTLGVLRSGRSVTFVPINATTRKKGQSKIRMFRDGARFFMIIVRICTFYSPMRVFLPVSVLSFLLGLTNYAITYFTEHRFTNMSALLFINSVLIFMMGLISEQVCQLRFEKHHQHVVFRENKNQPAGGDENPPHYPGAQRKIP